MKYINDCDSVLGPSIDTSLMEEKAKDRSFTIKHLPYLRSIDEVPETTELVIVGAGLAGITLAARAWHLGFSEGKIAILDTNEMFAENFYKRTKNVKQKVMRSSYIHHLAPSEDLSLADFGRLAIDELSEIEKKQLHLARMSERSLPPLDLFLSHVNHVVKAHNLHNRGFKFDLAKVEQNTDGTWTLISKNGSLIKTKYVILALGQKSKEVQYSNLVINAYEADISSYLNNESNTVSVIGGGNTAAHIILECLKNGKRVNWIIRDEERYACTDIPHKYWRDEGFLPYMKLSLSERINKIKEIYKGSAMLEHYEIFQEYKETRQLNIIEGEGIIDIYEDNKKHKTIKLSNDIELRSDLVISAIGLAISSFPEFTNSEYDLFNDFPVLSDETLELKHNKNIFVASSQSALSLGPAAKNIDGARISAERIFSEIAMREGIINKKNKKLKKLTNWSRINPVTN
ncbi:NAD(P)-binding domain-containing protein [Rossellomorea sp. DUT-2]|uniref:NAD(P)-binding domain-containing protein n=1 Tax=Rossellomorea sp. DUT-2 TaxID=3412021 RepID=UPI003D17707C